MRKGAPPSIEGYYKTADITEITGKPKEWVYEHILSKRKMFLVCRIGWIYYIEKTSFDRWWNNGRPLRRPKLKHYKKKKSGNPYRICDEFYGCSRKEKHSGRRLKECPINCPFFHPTTYEHDMRYADIIEVISSYELSKYRSITNLIAAKGADIMPKDEI